MKLYIVRHCQTEGNAAFKLQGSATAGMLSARGRKQISALSRFFSREKIDTLYCSPLSRARTTAEGIGRKKPVFRPELREMDFGKLEGLSHEQVEAAHPKIFDGIFCDPRRPFPGGESLLDVQNRLRPFVQMLQSEKGNPTVVVVGHNILNRVLLASLLDLPLEYCRMFKLKNASIAELDANPEHRRLYLLHNGFSSIGKSKNNIG